ncbi:DUF3179 domain-containing protein [Natronococcus sp. A-GB1]|uniref:DUF3179 domain-containing protein n=1 Tax=Natronococcus sp. A-GB1 TaxID=3037648 RepID=UPI00241FA1B8|nr:DUF3179 domain-containing protein [Natronococcus sp. A-GB1]MDG5759106.1 DUF3179 domain-containing protein [Natronococcus sp. A-GB1]
MDPTRRGLLATAAAVTTASLAGCVGDTDAIGPYEPDGESGGATPEEMTASPDEDAVAETAIPIADDQLPVSYSLETLRGEVIDGGVPQDGIPSIDDPVFEPVADVGDRFRADDPVFGVVREGEARVYPQSILVHHEIVNDEIGGESVAVTYCPLTGTAMGFERSGVEFGVSGNLVNSNLVMYDREDESMWPQMLGTAIEGPLEAASLREFPVHWSTWSDWQAAYPESTVLTEDTGYVRDYDDDPYGMYNPSSGYYREDSDPIFEPLRTDDDEPPKRMVLGARPPEGPLSIDHETLADERLLEIDHGDATLLAVHDRSIDVGHLYRNPDGETFELEDDRLVDADGDSYEPGEAPLKRVYVYDAMWFAWTGFYPDSAHFG